MTSLASTSSLTTTPSVASGRPQQQQQQQQQLDSKPALPLLGASEPSTTPLLNPVEIKREAPPQAATPAPPPEKKTVVVVPSSAAVAARPMAAPAAVRASAAAVGKVPVTTPSSAQQPQQRPPVIAVRPPPNPVVLPTNPVRRPVVVGPTSLPTSAKVVVTAPGTVSGAAAHQPQPGSGFVVRRPLVGGGVVSTATASSLGGARTVASVGGGPGGLGIQPGRPLPPPVRLPQHPQPHSRLAALGKKNLAGIVISSSPGGQFETFEGTAVVENGGEECGGGGGVMGMTAAGGKRRESHKTAQSRVAAAPASSAGGGGGGGVRPRSLLACASSSSPNSPNSRSLLTSRTACSSSSFSSAGKPPRTKKKSRSLLRPRASFANASSAASKPVDTPPKKTDHDVSETTFRIPDPPAPVSQPQNPPISVPNDDETNVSSNPDHDREASEDDLARLLPQLLEDLPELLDLHVDRTVSSPSFVAARFSQLETALEKRGAAAQSRDDPAAQSRRGTQEEEQEVEVDGVVDTPPGRYPHHPTFFLQASTLCIACPFFLFCAFIFLFAFFFINFWKLLAHASNTVGDGGGP